MNLSTDLDHRWSPVLSQWPKPVMAHRDPTSTAEDQSEVNRQVHQVQQQLEQTVLVLNQLESVLSQLPTEPDGAAASGGRADGPYSGYRIVINQLIKP